LNYFFGKQEHIVKISGIYWPQTKTIELNPFNLITYFSSDANGPDCQMDGSLTLYVEGADSVLYGQLNPVAKYRNMCPVLTISLNKEVLTDPGPDPDIPALAATESKGSDSLLNAEVILPAEVILNEAGPDSLRKTVMQESLKSQPSGPPRSISAGVPSVTIKETSVVRPEFTGRTFQQGPLILVDTDTIMLHLYDNGQVDNDSVTVFFNRAPVLEKQGLGLKPIILRVVLQPGENEIALFAENLGEIPPNTSLCLIYSGNKRYEINLMSNLASNGTVRIKRRSD
jgi:hypothetical protein